MEMFPTAGARKGLVHPLLSCCIVANLMRKIVRIYTFLSRCSKSTTKCAELKNVAIAPAAWDARFFFVFSVVKECSQSKFGDTTLWTIR